MATEEPPAFTPVDPYALARNEARAAELKRFYTEVSVGERPGGFALLLDGREARTPARAPVVLPTAAAAALLAAEWADQGPVIRPGEMVVTRLVNSVIDGVAGAMEPVRQEIVRYAGSDLLCYRADEPAELVQRQAEAWDPVLAWARERWGIRLYLAEGVVHVAQPDHALAAVDTAVRHCIGEGAGAPFRLGALHVLTTVMGSALLALAALEGAVPLAEAWAKAHVDEDFQASRWGEDAEALERRSRRWRDVETAARLATAVQPG